MSAMGVLLRLVVAVYTCLPIPYRESLFALDEVNVATILGRAIRCCLDNHVIV